MAITPRTMGGVAQVSSSQVRSDLGRVRYREPGQGEALRFGHGGARVEELQRELNRLGANPPLVVDGKLGPKTEAALMAITGSRSADAALISELRSTEVDDHPHGEHAHDDFGRGRANTAGERTAPTEDQRRQRPAPGGMRAGELQLANPPRLRADRPVSQGAGGVELYAGNPQDERAKAEHYLGIYQRNGGGELRPGETAVLGIRGLSRERGRHETTSGGGYDDTFVTLRRDRDGTLHATELRGATHPGQRTSTMSPDANGDGAGDVGMIRPGVYDVRSNGAFHDTERSFRVTSGGRGNIAGVRDLNHDGRFDDAEHDFAAARGSTLSGVLFHKGGTSAPRSIGCQTLAPSEYDRFTAQIPPGRGFTYVLVDANGR